jgi:hypothetical protein
MIKLWAIGVSLGMYAGPRAAIWRVRNNPVWTVRHGRPVRNSTLGGELARLGNRRRGWHCLWRSQPIVFSLPACGMHRWLYMNNYFSTATGRQFSKFLRRHSSSKWRYSMGEWISRHNACVVHVGYAKVAEIKRLYRVFIKSCFDSSLVIKQNRCKTPSLGVKTCVRCSSNILWF